MTPVNALPPPPRYNKPIINNRKGGKYMTSQAFNDAAAKHMETLKMYVPIVARVHGKEHPEFHDVHRLQRA